jgi:SAM-dependent methyltransferase
MNLDALWHDLECGGYAEDLPLWRELAAGNRGPVLDVGAGTGRVTLDLARSGAEVIALDIEPRLLEALARRARGLPVQTLAADARALPPGRPVSLIVVPMQTLQMFEGRAGRAAFLRAAHARLRPGGLVAAALADPVDCFDDDHPDPPPPDACDIAGVRYATQLLEVTPEGELRRRREIIGERYEAHDVSIRLDRVSADEVAAEAERLGFRPEPHREIPETERYLGSTVVMLRVQRSTGMSPLTRVPRPGAESISSVPPTAVTRSSRFVSPEPPDTAA